MRRTLEVVHLTSAHAVFDIRVFRKECRYLAKAGYAVTLVVPHDQDDRVAGVAICAVPRARGRWRRMTATVARVYRAAVRAGGDVYHFHDPELLPVGVLLKLHGKRVVYDAHEDLGRDILTKTWIPRGFRHCVAWLADAVEAACVRCLDGVVAATPTIAAKFPCSKTVLAQNFACTTEYPMAASFRARELAVYAGLLNAERGAQQMVDALALVPPALGVRLRLVGRIHPPSLWDELRRSPGWPHVEAAGERSAEEVQTLLGNAGVGLVTFLPSASHIHAQPNKLFEYMAAGLPVVASDFPRWRALIQRVGCGLTVDPRDPQAIAGALQWLVEHPEAAAEMGRRGREAAQREFSWDSQAAEIIQLYERWTGVNARPNAEENNRRAVPGAETGSAPAERRYVA